VSTRIATTRRPAITLWTRAALGLLALGGIAALAGSPPNLPAMPWQALQPTLYELLRQTIVCVVWLLLIGICVRFAWLAARPPQRAETVEHAAPNWLPERRRARRVPQRTDSRALLQLFTRPQTVERAKTTTVTEAPLIEAREIEPDAAEASGDAEAQIGLCLLGCLRIRDGDGKGLSERATRGLIAYLVLKRAPAAMDELVEALWPGEAPGKARQRLWKAKRQAQRVLSDALVRRQDGYMIDRDRVYTDIDELDKLRTAELIDVDELERVIMFSREEPLADIDYPWADGERRRLQAIQAEMLEQLASAQLKDGDASGALAAAERLIQLDSLNERGWLLAMEVDGAVGNRQAILDRYERMSRELDERLGLRPSAGAKDTYHRLLGQA
jgi:DNA-binding SARP family transcriptional activator